MSNLRYNLLSRGAKRVFNRSSSGACDCSPVKWSKYYQNQQYVYLHDDIFNVYTMGTNGPVLLLIHGGGYSALTWSLFAKEITRKVECQVLAVDLRGHGSTKTSEDENLALDVLAKDIAGVVNKIYEDDTPPIVIIGHSLGGAIAVAAASCITSVVGLCVIDVVEGTALESLSCMQNILRGRPSGFRSIEHAIKWSFEGGQTHNLEAARVSMPGQIKSLLTGKVAANDDEITCENGSSSGEKRQHVIHSVYRRFATLEEKPEDKIIDDTCEHLNNDTADNHLAKRTLLPPTAEMFPFRVPEEYNVYTWRIDLGKTEPFWTGWFKGLSQKFLDLPIPKVLLLANINVLDTALTVGQMQGKFQFQVLPRSGHAIHEDQPQRVADIIAGFLVKQKLAVAIKGFTPIMPAC